MKFQKSVTTITNFSEGLTTTTTKLSISSDEMQHGNEKSSFSDLSSCLLEVHIH